MGVKNLVKSYASSNHLYGIIEIPDSINIVYNTSIKSFMFHRKLLTFMY